MKFSEEQFETGCRALVIADGVVSRAREALRVMGIEVSERTLRDWKNSERYEWLKENRDQWLGEALAAGFENRAGALLNLIDKAILQAENRDDWDEVNVQSLGNFIKSGMTASAIAVDKAQLIRGRPTQIRETLNVGKALKELENLGVVRVTAAIESTAEEIPEGEQ